MVGISAMTHPTIAVIGAGFSGALLALHLLRRCPPHAHVALIDRDSSFGRGMAYGTSNPSHVLNVPAGRMSAFVDRPTDFLDWLNRQPADVVPEGMRGSGSFVSRKLYGDYIHEMLAEQAGKQDRLRLVHGDVVSLDRSGDPLVLHTDEGTRIEADLAVLAIGNFPPASFPCWTRGTRGRSTRFPAAGCCRVAMPRPRPMCWRRAGPTPPPRWA